MRMREAVEIVLELATENRLLEEDAVDDGLEDEPQRQEDAINMVADFLAEALRNYPDL